MAQKKTGEAEAMTAMFALTIIIDVVLIFYSMKIYDDYATLFIENRELKNELKNYKGRLNGLIGE